MSSNRTRRNFNLIIDAQFRPFSYDELSKPAREATQMHIAQEEAYAGIANEMAKINLSKDEREQYLNPYYSQLNQAVNDLSNNGLTPNSRSSLMNLRNNYIQQVVPVQQAATNRANNRKLRAEMLAKDPTIRFKNPEQSLDWWMQNGDTFDTTSISLTQLTNEANVLSKALSTQIRDGKLQLQRVNHADGKPIQGYYDMQQVMGMTPEEYNFVINNQPVDSQIGQAVLNLKKQIASKYGVSEYTTNVQREADNAINLGLVGALGTTSHKLIDDKEWEQQQKEKLEHIRHANAMKEIQARNSGPTTYVELLKEQTKNMNGSLHPVKLLINDKEKNSKGAKFKRISEILKATFEGNDSQHGWLNPSDFILEDGTRFNPFYSNTGNLMSEEDFVAMAKKIKNKPSSIVVGGPSYGTINNGRVYGESDFREMYRELKQLMDDVGGGHTKTSLQQAYRTYNSKGDATSQTAIESANRGNGLDQEISNFISRHTKDDGKVTVNVLTGFDKNGEPIGRNIDVKEKTFWRNKDNSLGKTNATQSITMITKSGNSYRIYKNADGKGNDYYTTVDLSLGQNNDDIAFVNEYNQDMEDLSKFTPEQISSVVEKSIKNPKSMTANEKELLNLYMKWDNRLASGQESYAHLSVAYNNIFKVNDRYYLDEKKPITNETFDYDSKQFGK